MDNDDPAPQSSNVRQITPTLKFNNYIEFKNSLYSYAVRYGPHVVATVNDFYDYPPPPYPAQNANPQAIQDYRNQEKAYTQYKRDCQLVCSIVYASLSSDVKVRFDQNLDAYRALGFGQLGLMMEYISNIVRETGQNSIMPLFTRILKHRVKSRQTWRQEIEDLINSLRSLFSQYPTLQDKARLLQDLETFTVVTSLSNIPEFDTHFQQTIYHLRQWPTVHKFWIRLPTSQTLCSSCKRTSLAAKYKQMQHRQMLAIEKKVPVLTAAEAITIKNATELQQPVENVNERDI
jgi:hypothetical protein